MKTVIVMRHSKAENDSPTGNDFDRVLRKKGKVAAQFTAKKLNELELKPNLIITSPVVRAKSTAQIIAEFFHINQKILPLNYLYNRLYTFKEIVDDVVNYDVESNTIIIIGHNPTISYLLQQINTSSNELLRTSSAVVFDFDVDNWSEVNASNSVRRYFIDRED